MATDNRYKIDKFPMAGPVGTVVIKTEAQEYEIKTCVAMKTDVDGEYHKDGNFTTYECSFTAPIIPHLVWLAQNRDEVDIKFSLPLVNKEGKTTGAMIIEYPRARMFDVDDLYVATNHEAMTTYYVRARDICHVGVDLYE